MVVMNQKTDDSIENAWVALARAHHSAMAIIESDIKGAGFPPLIWYDALLELNKAGDKGLRQFELGEKMLLPQYGLSRLVARLVGAGHVVRSKSNDDGRGQLIQITAQGLEIRAKMWPVYEAAMQKALGNNLSGKQLKELAGLLNTLTK